MPIRRTNRQKETAKVELMNPHYISRDKRNPYLTKQNMHLISKIVVDHKYRETVFKQNMLYCSFHIEISSCMSA